MEEKLKLYIFHRKARKGRLNVGLGELDNKLQESPKQMTFFKGTAKQLKFFVFSPQSPVGAKCNSQGF
ncbi:hypothetical protein SAMN03080617_02881 [Algoriphagus alkaliphilus]|uniref:Uncharacterized protein n=1 Tax=Algoriphagus alkaliphilus TaxID=279824 RepID=A0A1G5YVP1_9BACT|nr:hypothetical protein [Algoriphagus alkaliphilus]MBA4301076.1 hypothetical protein [Cyclobacterium sp.]SDA86504.1 hypothetical protein SAMN03080617_02881 [Algoriphagus alkaliphilus]